MADIKNLVILGDSMSDIGNKWTWPTGELGRFFGAMRVNETGRFSDGKNWTDFFVEWATGETVMWGSRDLTIRVSTLHRSLSADSVMGVNPWDTPQKEWPGAEAYLAELAERSRTASGSSSPATGGAQKESGKKEAGRTIRYVNYAMGGAIVTRDWAPKFGALTYLREQVDDYVRQRAALSRGLDGPTLHVIWIGLNDFVTAKRPNYAAADAAHLPTTSVYADWLAWRQNHPEELRDGVGVFPAVAEIQSIVETINAAFPNQTNDHHFMVVDLPSVYNAIRYIEGLGKPEKVAEAKDIEPVVISYNALLEDLLANWPQGPHAPLPGHVRLVRMNRWMQAVSDDLEGWGLQKLAQDPGVPVFYEPGLPPGPKADTVQPQVRNRITTSDLGHPTEAVYRLIARYIATQLVKAGHTLGRLDEATWPFRAPYRNRPIGLVGD